MKTILSLRRHHYLRSVGIFLIAVALIAGVVSCNGAETYDLIMAENPAGTGTATDETGTSPYAEDEVVDIKAVPADCYRFVNWQAPAGAFGNTTAAETTFTMPARDVTVTANFEPTPPDHFKFYTVDWKEGLYVGQDVQLVDQFGAFNVTVGDAISFGNPVKKVHGDNEALISDPNRHYTLYELDYGEEEPMLDSWQVVVNNQFGNGQELTVWGPIALAVPTKKGDHEMPVCLDHFLLYAVEEGPEIYASVNLTDQFGPDKDVSVYTPYYFANPVEKTVLPGGAPTLIEHEDEHLVFYTIDSCAPPEPPSVQIVNQFGEQTLDLLNPELLAVPSEKISVEQPLDHFKGYWAYWIEGPPPPGFPVAVQLEDQFITEWLGEPLDAMVLSPYLFANPTSKDDGEVWTPISNWNNHLTFYDIGYDADPQSWVVTVTNQFGIDQDLLVGGPFWLAVPTQKFLLDWPADLDHFLVYEVLDWQNVPEPVQVLLVDQFNWPEGEIVWRYEPEFFAIPVQKTDAGGTTAIKGDEHLVFYGITGGEFYWYDLPINNQFGPQSLYVWQSFEDVLGVPSQKIYWEGPYPYEPPD